MEAEQQSEFFLPENDVAIRLPAFEGPLDLLLFLIRRNEVTIYDIPIETVTRQYLEILGSMNKMDLEMAGEFFVMAATLMYIKSRMLLPQKEAESEDESGDEGADPRWELVQQLIEYKRFKEAAAELERLIHTQQDYLPRSVIESSATQTKRELLPVGRLTLWQTYNLVLKRLSEKIHEGEIRAENITVSDRMEYVLETIRQHRHVLFSGLFEESASITSVVATFLAVLELTRLGQILVRQSASFEEIEIFAPESLENVGDT